MPLNSFDVHALIRMAAGGLVNSLFAGVGIAGFAWILSRVAARNSSGTRFAVWFVALMGIALLPWVGSVGNSSSPTGSAPLSGAITLPESLGYWLFVAWAVGVALGLAHVAHGLYRLRRLRAGCTTVDPEQLDPALRASLSEIQSHRRVTLCVSEAIRVPAAIGYFRPMVVFPAWTLNEIPTAELNAILLHELAHLRRYDDWTNLVQKLVKAVLFFHPAIWFIESKLTLEREMACDDAVLATTYSPRAYAESLVSLAEKSFLRRGIQLAQAAVGHVQQLKLRLVEILRGDRAADGHGSGSMAKATIALMSLGAILSVYGISREPQLVTFSGEVPQMASAESAPLSVKDGHLQPTSLRYNSRGDAATPAVRRVELKNLRLARHVATRARVVLEQGALDNQAAEEKAPPHIMALSNYPMELTSAPVLVVFQGEQFGLNGPVFWRVTVLHLTPSQQRAIAGGFPKQI